MDIGAKLKKLRLGMDLTQEELADRTELTKGYISQLERDLTSPSISTLMDLLEALGTDPGQFFQETEAEQVVFSPDDIFVKEFGEGYTVDWLIPNAQKNAMEPIRVTLEGGARTRPDQPHEGEEFGFVLQGTVYLCLGDQRHRVRRNESFYFSCGTAHHLENPGRRDAVLLWVSVPPTF